MEKANELWLKNSGQHRTFSYGPAILGEEWFFLGMGGCACAKIPCAVSNAGGVSLSLSIAISESLAKGKRAKWGVVVVFGCLLGREMTFV